MAQAAIPSVRRNAFVDTSNPLTMPRKRSCSTQPKAEVRPRWDLRHCFRQRVQAVQSFGGLGFDGGYRAGEQSARRGIGKRRVAERPSGFPGDSQAVEMRIEPVIEASEVFEFDVGGGGKGGADGVQDRGVFGVLRYHGGEYSTLLSRKGRVVQLHIDSTQALPQSFWCVFSPSILAAVEPY